MKPKYSGYKPKPKHPIKLMLKNANFVKRHLLKPLSHPIERKALYETHAWTKENIQKTSSSSDEMKDLESGSHRSSTTSSYRPPKKYIASEERERLRNDSWSNTTSSSGEDSGSSDESENEQRYSPPGDETLVKRLTHNTDQEVANDSESVTEVFAEKRNFWLFQSEGSDMAVLVLRHPCSVVLSGLLQVRALSGTADVHGWQLSLNSSHSERSLEFVPIFSSKLCGSLVLSTVCPERFPKRVSLAKHLAARLHSIGATLLASNILSVATLECIVVALTRLELPGPVRYATTSLCPSLFSAQPSPFDCLRLGFSILPQAPEALLVTNHHREIARQICHSIQYSKSITGSPAPRIVVCGDRNTGKSTFVRFLINSILSLESCSAVYYLDGDPGQSEFTPSSSVALTWVDGPLLGPPLTHQKTPVMQCFVGGPSVEDTPDLFSQSLKKLITHYDENLTEVPLIVNTMGWTRGLGLSLLVDVLRLSRPSLVIQMDNQIATLPVLNNQFLVDECGWTTTRAQAEANALDIEFRRVNAINNPELSHADIAQLGLASPLHRSLSALTYLGSLVRNRLGEEQELIDVVPKCVPWSDLAVMLSSKNTLDQENLLDIINGSWVALCCVAASQISDLGNPALPKFLNSPSNYLIGYGLVRAIDMVDETILMLTPEPISRLQSVNALAIVGDLLPAVIYTSQECEGPIPYVSQTSVQSKGGLGIKIKQTHKKFL